MNVEQIVFTRSKIYGDSRNIGGLENYTIAFCEEASMFRTILLVSGSGSYVFRNGIPNKTCDGYSTTNQYLLTLYVGMRVLRLVVFKKDIRFQVFSVGLAGLLIAVSKSLGLLKNVELNTILFALEFMIHSRNSKKILTRLQTILGVRRLAGFYMLKYCQRYFTEFDGHEHDYIKVFPFLKDTDFVCLPDPVSVNNNDEVNRSILSRIESMSVQKKVVFISVGRDSLDKRRDLTIEYFKKLSEFCKKTRYKFELNICAPSVSSDLKELIGVDKNISVHEGLSDNQLQSLRKRAHFCICHSNQRVPQMSVLEDMAWGVIPIANSELGKSLTKDSAIIMGKSDVTESFELIIDLLSPKNYREKALNVFRRSSYFGRDQFSKVISGLAA